MPSVVELRVQDAPTVMLAVMLTGVLGQLTVRPVLGITTGARVMLPAKLKVLVRAMDMLAPPAPELKLTGVTTDSWKSPTCTAEFAMLDPVPGDAVPVSVTR